MCFLSTTFPNAPAHPPILFDQFLKSELELSIIKLSKGYSFRKNSNNKAYGMNYFQSKLKL